MPALQIQPHGSHKLRVLISATVTHTGNRGIPDAVDCWYGSSLVCPEHAASYPRRGVRVTLHRRLPGSRREGVQLLLWPHAQLIILPWSSFSWQTSPLRPRTGVQNSWFAKFWGGYIKCFRGSSGGGGRTKNGGFIVYQCKTNSLTMWQQNPKVQQREYRNPPLDMVPTLFHPHPILDSRRGLGIFLITTASRTALGPIQPPI